jgi:hypothetical protein
MRWLNRITEYLIVFGFGVIVGWHPTFVGMKAFFISGASFAVVIAVVIQVGGFLRDLYKDHKEELAQKQERLEQEAQKLKEKLEQEHNKEQIYNWIYHKTEDYKGKRTGIVNGRLLNDLDDPRFRSTEEIANALNMYPLEKVKRLCYINDKLSKMTQEDLFREKTRIFNEQLLEKWAIKEFVR